MNAVEAGVDDGCCGGMEKEERTTERLRNL